MNTAVPAGAVSTNTVFISNRLSISFEISLRPSYRLQPELALIVLVDLEAIGIHYTDEDINGSNEKLSFLVTRMQKVTGRTAQEKQRWIKPIKYQSKTKHFKGSTVEQSLRINVNGKDIV